MTAPQSQRIKRVWVPDHTPDNPLDVPTDLSGENVPRSASKAAQPAKPDPASTNTADFTNKPAQPATQDAVEPLNPRHEGGEALT